MDPFDKTQTDPIWQRVWNRQPLTPPAPPEPARPTPPPRPAPPVPDRLHRFRRLGPCRRSPLRRCAPG